MVNMNDKPERGVLAEGLQMSIETFGKNNRHSGTQSNDPKMRYSTEPTKDILKLIRFEHEGIPAGKDYLVNLMGTLQVRERRLS
jgi:hypothetical protein